MTPEIRYHDIRHAEKPKGIRPDDITEGEITAYRETHHLGPHATDDIVKQLIIVERGGPVYGQEAWDQPLKPNDATTLMYEGIRAAHDLGTEIFTEAELSPRGKLYLFAPSPAGRTKETQAAIEDRVNYLIDEKRPKDIKILKSDGLETLPADSITQEPDTTLFIFDHQGVQEIGPFSNEMLEKVNKLFGGETAGEMVWFARPEELEGLKSELKERFPGVPSDVIDGLQPKEYRVTPEEIIGNIVAYYERVLALAEEHFPNRPVEMYGVSHNMILDAATIRLLGKDVSANSVKELGGEARRALESGKITLSNGVVTVRFRGLENSLSRQDLHDLQEKLREEAKIRREQWGIS